MQCVRQGHTVNGANTWAHSLSADTLISLHDVFQKTGAGCPPEVVYTEDSVRELRFISF